MRHSAGSIWVPRAQQPKPSSKITLHRLVHKPQRKETSSARGNVQLEVKFEVD
jgi:hypothetical protein